MGAYPFSSKQTRLLMRVTDNIRWLGEQHLGYSLSFVPSGISYYFSSSDSSVNKRENKDTGQIASISQ